MRRILLLAAAAIALASPAAAQELQVGTRVRITAPIVRGDSRFVGTVTSTEGGRIRLRLDPSVRQDTRNDTISIPRNLVRRVEVSLGRSADGGRRTAAGTGALAGLVAGVGLGMALGAGSGRDGVKNPWTTSLWLGPALGAVGAGTGALIGKGEHEQWRIVPPARVAGLPIGRHVTVSIRLGF
ncbi:MAG TPA: hypothetical protein VGO40_08505 [Longimicrobium sp.]|jgi:hypothetical protein|nr:hypothetical protein [Longimicrobium sp.]